MPEVDPAAPPAAVEPPVVPPVVPPVAPPWYHGADDLIVGHLKNRGLDSKTPAEAALALAQAHREAEGFLGVPKEQLLRLPKDENDAEGWARLRTAAGAPADAKDYDFAGLKNGADQDLEPDFVDFSRGLAGKLGLSKEGARVLARELVSLGDSASNESNDAANAKLVAETAALKDNWGAGFEANKVVAANTAIKLFGPDKGPEIVAALEKVGGYAATMEALRMIGSKIGEDAFITPSNPGGQPVLTREQAIAEKDSLMKDPDFVNEYNNRGMASPAYKRMGALNAIINAPRQAA